MHKKIHHINSNSFRSIELHSGEQKMFDISAALSAWGVNVCWLLAPLSDKNTRNSIPRLHQQAQASFEFVTRSLVPWCPFGQLVLICSWGFVDTCFFVNPSPKLGTVAFLLWDGRTDSNQASSQLLENFCLWDVLCVLLGKGRNRK